MKPIGVLLLLFFLVAFQPAASTYRAVPGACRLTWTGYAEVGTYAPTGTVQLQSGSFEYDGQTLRRGRFEVAMRTIQHEETKLAEHLRGPDFFDAARYPTAVFVLREFRNSTATGQLTMRGISQPVQFPVTIERLPNASLRITGTALLDRTKFGVNHNSSSFFQNLGSYAIRNEFKLAFEMVAAKD